MVLSDVSTQFEIMKQYHYSFHIPNQPHKLFNELHKILLLKYYWFNMSQDIKYFVECCNTCNYRLSNRNVLSSQSCSSNSIVGIENNSPQLNQPNILNQSTQLIKSSYQNYNNWYPKFPQNSSINQNMENIKHIENIIPRYRSIPSLNNIKNSNYLVKYCPTNTPQMYQSLYLPSYQPLMYSNLNPPQFQINYAELPKDIHSGNFYLY